MFFHSCLVGSKAKGSGESCQSTLYVGSGISQPKNNNSIPRPLKMIQPSRNDLML